jgi:hypothetical protein
VQGFGWFARRLRRKRADRFSRALVRHVHTWPAVREFIAPLPLAAVALLALNDHLLKATFHNTLTGKLSDIAGCFFLPLYVSALLSVLPVPLRARLYAGAAVTTVLFASVSVSRVAADWVCRQVEVLSTPLGYPRMWIASDPTDLVCLPLVALAVAYGLSKEPECTASPQSV